MRYWQRRLAMLFTAPLALAAVFVGLWLTQIETNITAMVGMTMIVVSSPKVLYFIILNMRTSAMSESRMGG